MAAAPVEAHGPRFTGTIALAGALAGAVAGACTLLLLMLYGLFSGSRSFWDAPMAMFAWVFGVDHYTRNDPGNHIWPVILGVIGFVALMAILGIVFAAIITAVRTATDAAVLLAGLAFVAVVWVILRYAIVPLNSGEEGLISTSTVSPQWFWWLSFLVGGLALGLAYDAEHRLEPAWWGEEALPRRAQTPIAGGV